MTPQEVERVIKSVQDYYAFQHGYAKPVEQMLEYLEKFFDISQTRG